MMIIGIIIFLTTTTIAKHHQSTRKTLVLNDKFFDEVYLAIHIVMDNLFESIDLPVKFSNQIKLLLTMHKDLSNIAEKSYETFNSIENFVKNLTDENANKLDTVVIDILNKQNFSIYSMLNGNEHRHGKDNDRRKDKVKDKDIPEFEDSVELTKFINNFLVEINNFTLQDFKNSSLTYVRYTVPSTQNIKVWEPPSDLDSIVNTNTRRVYNGLKTLVRSFPFVVSIHVMGEFTCAGSIITRDVVITAASCLRIADKINFLKNNLKSIYVRLGSDHTTRGGETIPVEELYFHPEYEPTHLLNNLAIIILEKRKRISRQQNRIRRIVWDRAEGNFPSDTKSIVVVGWGASKLLHVKQQNPKLRVGKLDISDISDCQRKYTEDFITQNNFCAAYNGTIGGACNGDAGGPGIVGGVLMGVVSFGSMTCGEEGAPTVFTRVGPYSTWIDSVLNLHNNRNDLKLFRDNLDYPRGRDEKEVKVNRSSPIVKTDQPVVNEVIDADHYDKNVKYLKNEEQITTMEDFDSKEEKTYAMVPENVIRSNTNFLPGIETVVVPVQTTTANNYQMNQQPNNPTYKPVKLVKSGVDSEYGIDNEAVENDYTDNYEKSREKLSGSE